MSTLLVVGISCTVTWVVCSLFWRVYYARRENRIRDRVVKTLLDDPNRKMFIFQGAYVLLPKREDARFRALVADMLADYSIPEGAAAKIDQALTEKGDKP